MATVQPASTASEIFSAINAGAKKSGTGGSGAPATTNQDNQDRFLKLLVTQLKNQDPLNPLDNAAVTTQLAQINTVSGIDKLNTTLSTLLDSYSNTQDMQAAELIGKNVLVAGSSIPLKSGAAYGGVNLSGPADEIKINILNAAGTVVQTQSLGARAGGSFTFAWDGMTDSGAAAPDGIYKFEVSASSGGQPVPVESLQIGTVSALVRSKGGFLLDLGSLGAVDFRSVQQVL